jgi:hypothetical protein
VGQDGLVDEGDECDERGHVVVGAGCDIVLHGWASCGRVFMRDGVHPLYQRMYRCRTHSRTFGVFDDVCAAWLYAQPSPDGAGSMWDYVRPDPVIVQHSQSYYSADLLSSVVGMYQSRVEQEGIIEIVQQDWLAKHELNASDYTFYHWPPQPVPWWVAESGHQVMTDRRKLSCLLADCFSHYLKGNFDRDLQIARRYLCHGLSTDETFKVAKACSILMEPTRPGGKAYYKRACVALHTMHSSTTQMVVGYSFMPDKSAGSRAELFRSVWGVQRECPDAVVTRYVSTDNPVSDEAMLQQLHGSMFPGPYYRLSIGDDIWHVLDRVFEHHRGLAYASLRGSLLRVLQDGVVCAQHRALHIGADYVPREGEKGSLGTGVHLPLTVGEWQMVCEVRMEGALDAWLLKTQQGPERELLGEAAHKLALAKQRLRFLFSFVEHARELGVRGTTPNEGGHQGLNRRTKFICHMRPDHLFELLLYHAYLLNHACAEVAACNMHD